MEVQLSELKETNLKMESLTPYPEDDPIGFYDKDNQFKVVVIKDNVVMKKRISKKHIEVSHGLQEKEI